MLNKTLFLLLISFLFSDIALTEKINVFNFTQDEFETLKVKKVKGKTTWNLGSNEKGNFIKAVAEGTGSGLGKEIKIDISKNPFINIT